MSEDSNEIRFYKGAGDIPSLDDDERIRLLCACILNQQRAGFKNVIDARQFACQSCGKPGFNTGWGVVKFVCGAEVLSCGEVVEPCPSFTEDQPGGERR